jgi:ubiquinone/menaquinone biosynthesis C-methylase UbiE
LEEVPYLLPSDFEESNRLDMQHFMLKTAFQADVMAPIRQPRGILDVACGTGRWAREMAQRFPQANVVGIDLVEPTADSMAHQQSAFGTLPDNYLFIQGNIFQGLPFPDASFDYVHMRFVALAVPLEKWPPLVREIVRVCAPGGWIELVDFNTPLGGGPAFQHVLQLWRQLADTFKMDNETATHLAAYLRSVGVVNVQERRIAVNTADPQDRAARMCAVDLDSGIESSAPALIKLGMTTPEDMRQLRLAARQEYQHNNVSWQFCAAYGQRPMR